MRKVTRDNLELMQFDSLADHPGLTHALSLHRQSSGERFDFPPSEPEIAKQHRRRFCQALDLDPDRLVILRQVHGHHVHVITADTNTGQPNSTNDPPAADALCTNLYDIPLMLFGADCPLILLYDPTAPAIGLAHAGWRPTVGRITQRLAQTMIDQLGARPERMRAAIGPCICRDCYQVGPEVIQAVYQNLPDLDPDTLLLPPHPFQTDRSAPSQGAIQLSQQDRETSLHGGKVNTPYQPQPPDKNPPKTSNQQDFPPDCTGKTPKNTQKCTKKGHFSPQKGHFTQAQFNLELANSRQLQAAGLCKYTTEFSGCCTFEKNIFPSHRRDGNQAGRWALLATLSQP